MTEMTGRLREQAGQGPISGRVDVVYEQIDEFMLKFCHHAEYDESNC
jgi:hypothetical protein